MQSLNPERGKIATPHLDQLASEGMKFTDAHSGSSVCTPTRYGLLTGRYAWRTRLQRGVLDGGSDEPLIGADRRTLPAMLRERGYHTACIGKWHLGFLVEESSEAKAPKSKEMGRAGPPVGSKIVGGPTTRGFDYFLGCSNARTMASLIENDTVTELVEPIDMLPRLRDRSIEYLKERSSSAKQGKPFFLYLALTSPHTPIVPAKEWQGKSELGAYGDFVMQTDAVVGDVLAALKRESLAENTLVIFTADNGCSPQAGTTKLEKLGHFASAQHRGYKADIWEGGHRVPFLVRWPAQVQPQTTSGQLVCLTDLTATIAESLDVKLPSMLGEDSESFLPALQQKSDGIARTAIVHHSIQGKFSIRQGDWKLCLCAGSGGWSNGGGEKKLQLYDMKRDPAESKNLIEEEPAIAARLQSLLAKYVDEGRSTPGERQKNDVTVNWNH